MPLYTYRCFNGHEQEIEEPMLSDAVYFCFCGHEMKRKPQLVSVNWNGLKPSQGFIHPNIKQHIADSERYRDEMELEP